MNSIKNFIVLSFLLTAVSCMSTSKFARQAEDKEGYTIISDKVTPEVMLSACEYGLNKAGLKLLSKEKTGEGRYTLYAVLGNSMQGWGQNVRITIIPSPSEEGRTTAKYYSMRRIQRNVTENLSAIENNVETYAETYLTAWKEGIDINAIQKK